MMLAEMARFEIGGQFLDALTLEIEGAAHYKWRSDFPLTFSAASVDEIWPNLGFGHSDPPRRTYSKHPFLRTLVEEMLVVRGDSGRFHLDDAGAYWGWNKRNKEMFIRFECGGRFSTEWKPLHRLSKRLTLDHIKSHFSPGRGGPIG